MGQSAFKKYLIGPQGTGDITSGSVADTFNGGGPNFGGNITFKRVGKLYFDIQSDVGAPLGNLLGGDSTNTIADSADRVAALIGVTVDTVYSTPASLAGSQYARAISIWNGSTWSDGGAATTGVLTAFLAT